VLRLWHRLLEQFDPLARQRLKQIGDTVILPSGCADGSLAVKERATAQILAIILDKVGGVEDRGSSGLSTRQLLEP
jgi:hypothetical protein